NEPVERISTQQLVNVTSSGGTSVVKAAAAAVIVEAIPLGIALYIAVTAWNQPCDKPLQLWLAVTGALGVIMFFPGICSLCNANRKLANKELLEYMVRKQRAR
ncbi:unnamed protein product, partial [Symbiodinium sp. CCMP2456]